MVRQQFADKSLGNLVKTLFDSYVVVEGAEQSALEESKVSRNTMSMRMRHRMEMSEDNRAEFKAAIEDLVRLRNELVHHLIERFDIWTEDGCKAALEHLHASFDRIDKHFGELRQWAEHMRQTRALALGFMQSQVFEDMVVNGIDPDGSFDWPRTGIVSVLREAVRGSGHAQDGWLRLDEAVTWMALHHPDQVPQKYGCRTWPQVLSESRCFRLEYRPGEAGKVAWYRQKQ